MTGREVAFLVPAGIDDPARVSGGNVYDRHVRDGLGARDALYFDGSISRLYAPALNRADFGRRLGPIIGYTEQE